MLPPFNTLPHGVVTPPNTHTIKLFLLLLHNCNLATVMNCNLNTGVFQWPWVTPVRGLLVPEGAVPHGLRTTALERTVMQKG